MSILSTIFSFLTSDIQTTIISLIIGLIVYKIARFYVRLLSLPPGPIPVPIFGNILYFRGTKEHWTKELQKVPKKYGSVFTFWLGPKPFVLIRDIDIARETFRKNDFAGRPDSLIGEMLSSKEYSDVTFTDYGHTWEALRRVAHSAVQKYSTTDKLVYLASDCVDQTIDTMFKREGSDKPFVPFDYIYHMFLNILATSAFGRSYTFEDPEYLYIKYAFKDYFKEIGQRFILWEFIPIIRRFQRKDIDKMNNIMSTMRKFVRDKYQDHCKDYDESVIRDFCDTLISAKNDALKEGKESAPYLTDDNLSMAIFDLFLAGTDTSQQTFRWLLLFFLMKPQIKQNLIQEIESEIGDRIPTHEDRNRCHYVMAFIAEAMRYRNVVPAGVFHKAVVTSKIGDYTIPEGTGVFVLQGSIMNDNKYWSHPDQFKPERFLDNGKFITTRPSAYIPFGLGRRVCLGEKLAIADLFLVFARFIQKTSEYNITLHSHDGTDVDPDVPENIDPKPYKIMFTKRS